MNSPKVAIRGGFSDRNGISTLNTYIQYKSFDERTRIAIINELTNDYISFHQLAEYEDIDSFWIEILSVAYNQVIPVRHQSYYNYDEFDLIRDTIEKGEYDEVLTIVEFFITNLCKYFPIFSDKYIDGINNVFKKEYVGYRFLDDIIVPITNENEIATIEKSIKESENSISGHIKKALSLLSDRDHPDYENSIKESITAVETMCEIICGERATLGSALKKLEKNGIFIHSSLKSAFDKLYGYTSDANGIRHAGDINGPDSTFEEAQYMLVSCTAFINYLNGLLSKSVQL